MQVSHSVSPSDALLSDFDMADMLRKDLADARKAWLTDAKQETTERLKREQSDFLAVMNHER